MATVRQTNFLVIGSGISGLNFALNAAKKGRVLIVTKKKIIDSSTNFAQGGIAAVLDKTDDFKQHVKDTMEAGAYHNDKRAVKFMVKNSTAAVHRLIDLGVEFAKENGELKLTREGGHNMRRIAYVGDYTGREIERILVKRVKENKNITVLEDAFALKLLTKNRACFGAQIIHKNKIENVLANQTILATGGIGQLFQFTTNPPISTGDGIALGAAAGCKTRDLEFIQFHPTALAIDTYPRFLISETVRGESARLINSQGEYFMEKVHPLKDLAPRDIVAREIYARMKNGPVYLDCREMAGKMLNKSEEFHNDKFRPRTELRVTTSFLHRSKSARHNQMSKLQTITNYQQSAEILQTRFPQIYKELLRHGYHMEKDLIPVTPAAHYICGGLVTDLHGRAEMDNFSSNGKLKNHPGSAKPLYLGNLFAFGEVTCTGVHGANRLASNSLLEALVFSNQIVKRLVTSTDFTKIKNISYLTPGGQLNSKSSKVIPGDNFSSSKSITSYTFKLIPKNSPLTKIALALKQQIKYLMWQYAGIIRNRKEIKEKAIPEMKKIIKRLEKLTNLNTFPGLLRSKHRRTEISSHQKLAKIRQSSLSTWQAHPTPTNQTIAETLNMAQVGLLILQAAHKRKKSLGCHFIRA